MFHALSQWIIRHCAPWHALRWCAILAHPPRTDRDWTLFFRAYRAVYGVDAMPMYSTREEWEYHPGVEIWQYEEGH